MVEVSNQTIRPMSYFPLHASNFPLALQIRQENPGRPGNRVAQLGQAG